MIARSPSGELVTTSTMFNERRFTYLEQIVANSAKQRVLRLLVRTNEVGQNRSSQTAVRGRHTRCCEQRIREDDYVVVVSVGDDHAIWRGTRRKDDDIHTIMWLNHRCFPFVAKNDFALLILLRAYILSIQIGALSRGIDSHHNRHFILIRSGCAPFLDSPVDHRGSLWG